MGAFARAGNMLFTNWLYGDWDESKYAWFKAGYMVPGLREYMDYLLDQRSDKEYLENHGLDYSDIHDPRKLSQTSSSVRFVGSTYRMVSKNIEDLYK